MPVGRWVIRTAESVVFTCCPPAPGRAHRVDADFLRRHVDVDLLGLRQHRHRRRRCVDAPARTRSPAPAAPGARRSRTSAPQRPRGRTPRPPARDSRRARSGPPPPRPSASRAPRQSRWYIRARSAANKAASSPPVPARISRIADRSSAASFGSSAICTARSAAGSAVSIRSISSAASPRISGSSRSRSASARSRRRSAVAADLLDHRPQPGILPAERRPGRRRPPSPSFASRNSKRATIWSSLSSGIMARVFARDRRQPQAPTRINLG